MKIAPISLPYKENNWLIVVRGADRSAYIASLPYSLPYDDRDAGCFDNIVLAFNAGGQISATFSGDPFETRPSRQHAQPDQERVEP